MAVDDPLPWRLTAAIKHNEATQSLLREAANALYRRQQMPDNPKKRGPRDRNRISVSQYYERRDWCKRLGINAVRLREAVKAVGPMVKDVKRYLIEQIERA